MSADCAQVRELAPDMALGTIDGAERAEVLAHMAQCASCRNEVGELADVVDRLLTLAPAVEPPPGLSDRVLDAIRADTPAPAAARRPAPRRWRTRHLVVAGIAAALLAVVATAGVTATHRPSDREVTLNARTLHVVPMIGADDHHLGDAYVSNGADPWLLVNVGYGLDGAGYRLVGVEAEGGVVDIGPMRSLSNGQWAWAGRVNSIPSLVEVRIVDPAGGVACRASLV